jgi:lactate dehydrogenase-like 2-hydroxyacid dehydrogenase
MKTPILIATALPPAAIAAAQDQFDVRVDPTVDTAQIWQVASEHRAVAILISGRTRLTADLFARVPTCVKVIATASAGFDHVDLAAAKAAGVMVTNAPDVLSAATADLTLFLLLGACRRGKEYLEIMASGWRRHFGFDEMLGIDLNGRTLGIVGMGRIGQAVAHRAKAFGMSIIYHNRNRLGPEQEQDAVYYPTLDAMLPHTHMLCLTAPSAGPKPLIAAAQLALLPRGAVLVNSGRGALVDEDALIAALQSGQLAAAGLDVFREEPAHDLRLQTLPNVFATPHMGSATLETRTAMGLRALENIAAALAGRPPGDLLNP